MTTCVHLQQRNEFPEDHRDGSRMEIFPDHFGARQRPGDFLGGCGPQVSEAPRIKLRTSWIAVSPLQAGCDSEAVKVLPPNARTCRAPKPKTSLSRKPSNKPADKEGSPVTVEKRSGSSDKSSATNPPRQPRPLPQGPQKPIIPNNASRFLHHSNEFDVLDQPTGLRGKPFSTSKHRGRSPTPTSRGHSTSREVDLNDVALDEMEDVALDDKTNHDQELSQLVRLDAATHVRPSRMNSAPSQSSLRRTKPTKRTTPKRNVSFSEVLLRTKVVPRYIEELGDDDDDDVSESWDDDVLDKSEVEQQAEQEAREQLKQQRAQDREQLREYIAKINIEPTRRTPRRHVPSARQL